MHALFVRSGTGPRGIRTPDRSIMSRLLLPLSYGPRTPHLHLTTTEATVQPFNANRPGQTLAVGAPCCLQTVCPVEHAEAAKGHLLGNGVDWGLSRA